MTVIFRFSTQLFSDISFDPYDLDLLIWHRYDQDEP